MTLSPWLPASVCDQVKKLLKTIEGCAKLRVYRSSLVENGNGNAWRGRAGRLASEPIRAERGDAQPQFMRRASRPAPMMTPAEILQAYASLGWKNNNDPMSQVLALRREGSCAGELVLGFLDSGQKHSTFIDTALDLMDDIRMPPRCGGSGRMRGTASTARRWKKVLDSAALQWPELWPGG